MHISEQRTIQGPEEMQAVARDVARELVSGDILLLYGELGAGKTTFVQGLARALGITETVTSPTFTIVGEYAVESHSAITILVHVDLYRLEEATVASDPAVRDVLDRASDPGRLTVIEWAERLGETAPKGAKKILFKHLPHLSQRQVTLY